MNNADKRTKLEVAIGALRCIADHPHDKAPSAGEYFRMLAVDALAVVQVVSEERNRKRADYIGSCSNCGGGRLVMRKLVVTCEFCGHQYPSMV